MKGKLALAKRKRNRRESSKRDPQLPNWKIDSLQTAWGRNVDYFPYLLMFQVKKNPDRLDTLQVVHGSESKTLIETDQSRLSYMIDTIGIRNVILIFIKENYEQKLIDGEHRHVTEARIRAVRKAILKNGISATRVKIINRE